MGIVLLLLLLAVSAGGEGGGALEAPVFWGDPPDRPGFLAAILPSAEWVAARVIPALYDADPVSAALLFASQWTNESGYYWPPRNLNPGGTKLWTVGALNRFGDGSVAYRTLQDGLAATVATLLEPQYLVARSATTPEAFIRLLGPVWCPPDTCNPNYVSEWLSLYHELRQSLPASVAALPSPLKGS